ncbi:hypothetical protein [Antrihabitans spumae]|jgi:hypothetical protein|uniref:Uncharacterized protein n=1 Tax=Antrihabitans spumae TaxID=3373370 RepID=A0ABW7KDR9_9NOCA
MTSEEDFDPEELAAAQRLDDDITRTLAGTPARATDPTVLWLATSLQTRPPRSLYKRIAAQKTAREQREWRIVQFVAAALALLIASHGISIFTSGEWIARNIGEPYAPHAAFESAFAYLAVAGTIAAGAIRKSWTPVAVVAGLPLGLVLAVHGASEVTHFAYGAALHLSEGVFAVALVIVWWRFGRYRTGSKRQE